MGGCFNCKFQKSEVSFDDDNKMILIYTCLSGNTEINREWWENNGNKNRMRDSLDNLDCRIDIDITKTLDKMISTSDKMLKLLKNK